MEVGVYTLADASPEPGAGGARPAAPPRSEEAPGPSVTPGYGISGGTGDPFPRSRRRNSPTYRLTS